MDMQYITITSNEQKKLLLEMLSYVDKICRDNNINYSMIGGSLIGAVRHHGYIPWDDDIDIILTKDNYDRLKKILDSRTGKYQTLKYGHGGERFAFTKLIDTRTHLREYIQERYDDNYGVFIDIFCYYPTSMDEKNRRKHYNHIRRIMKFLSRIKVNRNDRTRLQNIKQFIKNTISRILGYKFLNTSLHNTFSYFVDSDYVVSNWPIYDFEKEIQLKKNTEEYIDAKFENLTVMIFKNYDEILRTTFGDYMQLPPESERVPKHNMTAWWREGYEDEAKKLRARMNKKEKNGKAKR